MGNAAAAKKIMMRGALMPGAQRTHSLACDVKWHTYVITTGSDRSTGIPRSAVRENPGFDFKQPILRRHCEWSEAIHRAAQRKNGLLRRCAPRNDVEAAAAGYLAALVVNQICGVPLTPAFSIVVFRSGDDAKALALSAVLKSCVTVTSFALSTDW